MALGIAGAHDIANAAHIHAQRVDAQIGQAAALGQVLGQGFQIQRLAPGAQLALNVAEGFYGADYTRELIDGPIYMAGAYKGFQQVARALFCARLLPLTVRASPCSRPCSANSRITTGSPPAS